jgi:hypothetical protein
VSNLTLGYGSVALPRKHSGRGRGLREGGTDTKIQFRVSWSDCSPGGPASARPPARPSLSVWCPRLSLSRLVARSLCSADSLLVRSAKPEPRPHATVRDVPALRAGVPARVRVPIAMAGLALAIDLLLQQQPPAIASKGLHSFSALSALAASAAAASAVSFLGPAPAHSSLFAHFDARCVLYILRDPLCGEPLHGNIVSSFLLLCCLSMRMRMRRVCTRAQLGMEDPPCRCSVSRVRFFSALAIFLESTAAQFRVTGVRSRVALGLSLRDHPISKCFPLGL